VKLATNLHVMGVVDCLKLNISDWISGISGRISWTSRISDDLHHVGHMLRYLVIVVLGLFGDPTYLARVWFPLLVGACLVALGYWFVLRLVLPMWPGVVAILVAAVVGVAWEIHASNT
jgi:hypothetical protein